MASPKKTCEWELIFRKFGGEYFKAYGHQVDGISEVKFYLPDNELATTINVSRLEIISKWSKEERQKHGLSARRI